MNDKVVHFVLFAVLGGALGLGRRWSGSSVPHWVVLTVGMLYGASDEWHQALVPNRTPSLGDWLADTAGVFTGYLLVMYLSRSAEPTAGAVSQAD